ncbi:long-chain-fatty-acid--CoA ligase [Aeromicrobium massiliense]|uniref:long-chain-fatty-acid--CoA ligase n=1 Tax=Aeromicrobium massiliense TaxID=1464554 RepID=UPI0002DE782A|nr:long-chain-fatty-acid--CoA ligase [Aeromicrobium massiliense]
MAVPPATFVFDHLRQREQEKPDAPCWLYEGRSWTWAEAADGARRLAGALRAAGVGRGGTVAFLDKNNPAIMQTTYAAALLGAKQAIVNWRLAGDELDYVVNDSGATVLLVGHELLDTVNLVRDRLTNVERVVVVGGPDDEYEALVASGEPLDQDPAVTPDDVVTVMYSSGTTGRPKGVMLTQHNLVQHTAHGGGDVDYADDDMLMVAMPMFHVGGSSYAFFGPAAGIPAYVVREVEGAKLAGAVMAGCTHAFLVPAVVAGLIQAGPEAMALFSRLKVFSYGAAPMPLPVLRTALEAWPTTHFMQVYGMTEMCGVATILDDAAHRDEAHPERLVSAGRPIEGVELRVVDPATGRDVEPGTAGELWWRTEQSTPGYLGRPEATAELFADDGWLRSGDVGRVDDGGFVFIEDRIKDMIITGGENVYSPEVERVLAEHPDVLELAVIGVPDDRWGEAVKAVVVLKEGSTTTADDLRGFARERLAHYKVPSSFDVLGELPRNPSGKILKRELRKPYWSQASRQV